MTDASSRAARAKFECRFWSKREQLGQVRRQRQLIAALMSFDSAVARMICSVGKWNVHAPITANQAEGLFLMSKGAFVLCSLPTLGFGDGRVYAHVSVRTVTQDKVLTVAGRPQARREPKGKQHELHERFVHDYYRQISERKVPYYSILGNP